jgi:serine/threonine-protein kinase
VLPANDLSGLQIALCARYRLETELGRGGMATVYRAHDLKHDRAVALKVLDPAAVALLGADRFQREIRTAARLQHPHIVQLHDSGEAAGLLYYTMPLVDGGSLRQRLVREGRLPLSVVTTIVRDVAMALDYAHRHGVLHRDVKPENIMLSEDGALVTDFGSARAFEGLTGDMLTQAGFLVGTPAYMSPEQAAGHAGLDGRSDQYSLALVAFEVLAGRPLFDGPTPQAVMSQRFRDPAPRLKALPSELPPAVSQVLRKALAAEPSQRFVSVTALADALASAATAPHQRISGAFARGLSAIRGITGPMALVIGVGAAVSSAAGSPSEPGISRSATVSSAKNACAVSFTAFQRTCAPQGASSWHRVRPMMQRCSVGGRKGSTIVARRSLPGETPSR